MTPSRNSGEEDEDETSSSERKALAELILHCVLLNTDDLASKVDLCTPLTRATELELVAYFRSWLQRKDSSSPQLPAPARPRSLLKALKNLLDSARHGAEQAARKETQWGLCWLLVISLLKQGFEPGSQCSVQEVVATLHELQTAMQLESNGSELLVAAVVKSLVKAAAEAACRGTMGADNLADLCTVLYEQLFFDPGKSQDALCSDATTALLVTKLLAAEETQTNAMFLLFGLLRKAAYLDPASPAQLELCGRLLKPNCQCVEQLADLLPWSGNHSDEDLCDAIPVLSALATLAEHPLAAPVMRSAGVLHRAEGWAARGPLPAAQAAAIADETGTVADVADPAGQTLLLLSRLPLDAKATRGPDGTRCHFEEALNYLNADPGDRVFEEARQVAARVLGAALPSANISAISSVGIPVVMRAFRLCWERFPDLQGPIADVLRYQLPASTRLKQYFPADETAIWTELAQMITHTSRLVPGTNWDLATEGPDFNMKAWPDLVVFMGSMLAAHDGQTAAMRPILCTGEFFDACVRFFDAARPEEAASDADAQFPPLDQLATSLWTILTQREYQDPRVQPLLNSIVTRVLDNTTYSRDWLVNTLTISLHGIVGVFMAHSHSEPEHIKAFATEERVQASWDRLCAMVDDGMSDEQLKLLKGAGTAVETSSETGELAAMAVQIRATGKLMLSAAQRGINLASLEWPHAAKVVRAVMDVPAGALPALPSSDVAKQLVSASLLLFSVMSDNAKLNALCEAAACPDALTAKDGSTLPPMRMHPALAAVCLLECTLKTLHAKHDANAARTPAVKSPNKHPHHRSHKVQATNTQPLRKAEQQRMGELGGLICGALYWQWRYGKGARQLLCERQAGALLATLLQEPNSVVPSKDLARSQLKLLAKEMAAEHRARAAEAAIALLEAETAAALAPSTPARTRKQRRRAQRTMAQMPVAGPAPAATLQPDSSSLPPAQQDGASLHQQDVASEQAMPRLAAAQPPDLPEADGHAPCRESTGSGADDGAVDPERAEASSAPQACQADACSLGAPGEAAPEHASAGRSTVTGPQEEQWPEVVHGIDHHPHASSSTSGIGVMPASSQVNTDGGGHDSGETAGNWSSSAAGASTSAPGSAGSAAVQAQEASSWHACLHLDAVRLDEELCCPITQELLQDPVIAPDGHTYERSAIQAWLAKTATSPMTGLPLEHCDLIPNLPLQHFLQKYEVFCELDAD